MNAASHVYSKAKHMVQKYTCENYAKSRQIHTRKAVCRDEFATALFARNKVVTKNI